MNRKPWIAVALLLAIPAEAPADPFEDFRIPDHSWSALFTSLSAYAERDQSGDALVSQRTINRVTDLEGRGLWARDGETLQLNLDGGLRMGGSLQDYRLRHAYSNSIGFSNDESRVRNKGLFERWEASVRGRGYPWETSIGLELVLSATGNYGQQWVVTRSRSMNVVPNVDLRQTSNRATESWSYVYSTLIQVGAGLGRVRDATGVLDARVLEQRLIESGALTRPLSAEARAKLAALAYVEPRFGIVHDRPDRYVWRDIERILRDDGALGPGGLDAWSVLRGRESYELLPRSGANVLRSTGYFVGPIAIGVHQHTILREDETGDQASYQSDTLYSATTEALGMRTESWVDDLELGGEAEFHRPFGWRWQLDVAGQAASPVIHADRGLDAVVDVACNYLIADRWQATAFANYQRRYFSPDDGGSLSAQDSWRTNAGAALAWYVEDRTWLSITAEETQSRGAYVYGLGPRAYQRHGTVRFGVQYQLSGRLSAPGLIGTMMRGR